MLTECILGWSWCTLYGNLLEGLIWQRCIQNFILAYQSGRSGVHIFETLRLLDDNYHFYSKKFKGIENAKEEVEIDFLIFNGKNCFICLEVKGGEIEYKGAQQVWIQNNAKMKKSPDRQAANACHTFIKFMGKDVYDINVDWALGFPQCSSLGRQRIAEVDPKLIIDEGDLSNICHKVDTIINHVLQEAWSSWCGPKNGYRFNR